MSGFKRLRAWRPWRQARPMLALSILMLAAASGRANPFLGAADSAAPAPVAVSGGAAPFAATQLSFRDKVAAAFSAFKEAEDGAAGSAALGAILAGAFAYGLLHAAGPGHRKTVVFSLFLARKARWWEPLAAGFLTAGIHAAVGVSLVGILSLLSGAVASLAGVEGMRIWMEGITFAVLALVALILAIRTVRGLLAGKTHSHGPHGPHGVTEEDGEDGVAGGKLYAFAAVSSLVPCPGATMLLLFALYLDLPLLGVLGVLAMSAGMAIVISAAGYLSWFGRSTLFHRLKARERTIGLISSWLELGSFLFMFSLSLYAAWPFLASLTAL